MKQRPGFLFRVLGCVLLCAFPACRPLNEREVLGRVLAVDGNAQTVRDGETVRLTTGTRLEPGAKIVLPEEGRVDLMLLPGILVELSGASEIEVKHLHLARNGDETIHPMTARVARVELRRGILVASIGQTQTRSQLFVETPAGILAAGTGRTFLIDASGKTARVMSIRGRLAFVPANGGASKKIESGHFAQWPNLTEPKLVADAGPELQAEVRQILIAKSRLLSLEKAGGSAFLPWLQ